ncbi:hypothetical protein BJY04DRAFT_176747 [Aspergillus karnatakaensis]|uniref:uncharacterized protein n=1 Tax=Aspergillus karnatakaensis TaxID=1810916 RepID=UPI003CCD7B3F
MPSATSTLGWSLVNWGSVPETYTIASSCTASTDTWVAYTDMPEAPFWPEVCVTATTDACWPAPTDQRQLAEYANNPYMLAYFSPAVNCPSGWKSIGEAAHPTDGPVTSSGVFHGYPGRFDYDAAGNDGSDDNNDDPIIFGYKDALGALLDSGETAIACCLDSMTVAENGVCYEHLPSHPVSTACEGTWVTVESTTVVSTSYMLAGTTRTGLVEIPATGSINPLPIASRTTTFAASETGKFAAVRLQGAIFLVHREADVSSMESPAANMSLGTEATSGEANAAVASFYTGTSGWGQMWRILGCLGIAALTGLTLVLLA